MRLNGRLRHFYRKPLIFLSSHSTVVTGSSSSQLMPRGSGQDGLVVLGELGFQVFVILLGGSKVFQTCVKQPLQSPEWLVCDGREWLSQRVRKGICHPPFSFFSTMDLDSVDLHLAQVISPSGSTWDRCCQMVWLS